MSEPHIKGPLQPGDRAPNVVLDAITRQGKWRSTTFAATNRY